MEITTSPHRPASTPWGRLVALVVILGPVSVLVLLPLGLGLQRYVMSGDSMAGDEPDSIPRGAVVFERLTPVSDLRPGDVITYRAPASSGLDGMVTHRIVEVTPQGIRTQGDAEPEPDPWLVRPDEAVVPRVVLVVPYVGYAYLALADPLLWLVGAGALGLGLLVITSAATRRRAPVQTGALAPAAPAVPGQRAEARAEQ